MTFFILAGGLGKRAQPLSHFKPKPAFPLGGTPLIYLLRQQLHALGCSEGFVNLHHLGDQVVAALGPDPGVRFVRESELSGSLVLRRALPRVVDWLLAVNGDTFLEIPLAEMQQAACAAGSGAVDGVLAVRRDGSGRYAGLHCAGGLLLGTAPLPGAARAGLMYAGAALFSRRALERIEDRNFFRSIEKRRLRFRVVEYRGPWLDLGTPESYFRANWQYLDHCGRRVANVLSPGARIHPQARVERSVLWERACIGPGAALSGCIVANDVELRGGRHRGCFVSGAGAQPLR